MRISGSAIGENCTLPSETTYQVPQSCQTQKESCQYNDYTTHQTPLQRHQTVDCKENLPMAVEMGTTGTKLTEILYDTKLTGECPRKRIVAYTEYLWRTALAHNMDNIRWNIKRKHKFLSAMFRRKPHLNLTKLCEKR